EPGAEIFRAHDVRRSLRRASTKAANAARSGSLRIRAGIIVILNERYGTTLMPARMRKLPDLAALAAFVDARRKDRRTS
ncbi:MAG: hypothetical protein AAGF49_05470, partial [Pseudomonadota bacterium]